MTKNDNLNKLTLEELSILRLSVIKLRERMIEIIEPYNYTLESFISKSFQNDIEVQIAKKVLTEYIFDKNKLIKNNKRDGM